MILTNVRKIIILALLIGFAWVVLCFNINLQSTFIFQIAEQIVNYNLFIVIALTMTGVVGFTYKNWRSFYSVYINIVLIIGYLTFISMCVTNKYTLSNTFSCIAVVLFSTLYVILFLGKERLNYIDAEDGRSDLSPIYKYNDLYESRVNHLIKLIELIKDDKTNNGYSICVSGEWGTGKTSFINSVMDKINEDSKKGVLDFKIEEIRINAMELDDLESLIKYFFNRVKDILQANGLYVGINSEYQDLIGSLAGTVIDESISNFMLSRFSSNSDYRENLKNLSQLIERELPNSKIIIIVDDLERCDNAKVMDFLFFIKEIAMLNRCITIFVTDYKKMLEFCDFKEEFMEKFFNCRINLQPVSASEIVNKSIVDEDFLKLLVECKYYFQKNVVDIEKDQYLYINDTEKRTQQKEEDRTKAINYQTKFDQLISNPRRIIKIYNKYVELVRTASAFKSQEGYSDFLVKVDYKKQVFLLSLIYGLYPEEYEIIENSGLSAYRYHLYVGYENADIISIFTHKEWDALSDNYIIGEKVRFCSYLLRTPNELPNIANGFSTLQEEYVASINNNQKPNNADLASVLKELIGAKFDTFEEKEKSVYKAIILYSSGMSFDDLLLVIADNSLKYDIAQDDIALRAFCEVGVNLNIVNKQNCMEGFILFSQRYLRFKLSRINRLVLCAYLEKDSLDNINEVVLNKHTCNQMIDAYCEKISTVFNINLASNDTGFKRLEALYKQVIDYLEDNDVLDCNDVHNYVNVAKSAINNINCLFGIEKYINSYASDNTSLIEFSENNMLENLSKLPDYIAQHNIDEAYNLHNNITSLFYQLLDSNLMLSEDDLNNVNAIILAYYEKVGDSPAPWRRMYIQMKNKSQ